MLQNLVGKKNLLKLYSVIFINLVYNYKYKVKCSFDTFGIIYHPKFFRIKTIFNLNRESLMIYDTQVYTALIISLLAGILAIRLGSTLYE